MATFVGMDKVLELNPKVRDSAVVKPTTASRTENKNHWHRPDRYDGSIKYKDFSDAKDYTVDENGALREAFRCLKVHFMPKFIILVRRCSLYQRLSYSVGHSSIYDFYSKSKLLRRCKVNP